MLDEFTIIDRYFRRHLPVRDDVVLGIGDDAAVVRLGADRELVVAVDTLVAGRHFPPSTAPEEIGWKALAVNLSDLAAMGADPAWCTLALALPDADEGWLAGFVRGFGEIAHGHGIALIGGDTTRGPLTITVTVHGSVPAGSALMRSGAEPGDCICVTGTVGDAALALTHLDDGRFTGAEADWLRARLDRPTPRVAAGQSLRGRAHAAIDISDGLLADLGHILDASGCGATVRVDRLPRSHAFVRWTASEQERRGLQLAGGDDYELCVCLPPALVRTAAADMGVDLTVIGTVEAAPGLRLSDERGPVPLPPQAGFNHFAPSDGIV